LHDIQRWSKLKINRDFALFPPEDYEPIIIDRMQQRGIAVLDTSPLAEQADGKSTSTTGRRVRGRLADKTMDDGDSSSVSDMPEDGTDAGSATFDDETPSARGSKRARGRGRTTGGRKVGKPSTLTPSSASLDMPPPATVPKRARGRKTAESPVDVVKMEMPVVVETPKSRRSSRATPNASPEAKTLAVVVEGSDIVSVTSDTTPAVTTRKRKNTQQ
jgi:hypothetical protein